MSHSELEDNRRLIDMVDANLIGLLQRRMELALRCAPLKPAVVDTERRGQVMTNVVGQANHFGLDPVFVKNLYRLIMNESERSQSQKQVTKTPETLYDPIPVVPLCVPTGGTDTIEALATRIDEIRMFKDIVTLREQLADILREGRRIDIVRMGLKYPSYLDDDQNHDFTKTYVSNLDAQIAKFAKRLADDNVNTLMIVENVITERDLDRSRREAAKEARKKALENN